MPGILERSKKQGEEAPGQLLWALKKQAGDRRMTGEKQEVCHESQKLLYYGKYYRQTAAEWGNGLGCLPDVSYSLTCMDSHAVFCEKETYQKTVRTLTCSDYKGAGNQYINGDKCVVENKEQVRRLTPLECERLQGFPDGWTDIPGASDNARYRALGNSAWRFLCGLCPAADRLLFARKQRSG